MGIPIRVEGERLEAREVFSTSYPGAGTIVFGDSDLAPEERVDREVGAPHGVFILRNGRQTLVQPYDPFDVDLDHLDGGDTVKAPMHGKLVAVFVTPGDRVEKGQRLAVVEAMKMEHALVAPADGEVVEVAAEPGTQVAEGARLIVLKTDG